MNEHEPAAAEVSRSWQSHRERKAHGDRGIDRVASFKQNPPPDFTRGRILADDHAASGRHWTVDAVVADDGLGCCVLGLREDRLRDEKQQHDAMCYGHCAAVSTVCLETQVHSQEDFRTGLISDSAGMPNSRFSRQIILRERERLRLSTS